MQIDYNEAIMGDLTGKDFTRSKHNQSMLLLAFKTLRSSSA